MRGALEAVCGLIIVFSLLFFPPAPSAAAAEFFDEEIATGAVRYEAQLAARVDPGSRGAQQWLAAAHKLAGKDPRTASGAYAAAAMAAREDGAVWLALGRSLAAVAPNDADERYRLQEQAASAAYIAYRRAANAPTKAQALALLAELQARRQLFRPALEAYKASLALAEAATVRAAFEALREEHGFRILDYTIDSDAVSPRMCVQFSEELAKGRIDFAKFVRVDGKDPPAVSSDAQQLCVEGFKHGERYQVEIRGGLPSSVGESLSRAAEYVVYVRDRQPAVRFAGRNYVLPRSGQQGLPLVSVNTDMVDLEIYRIGDRSLAPAIVNDELHEQLRGYSLQDLADGKGKKVWSGQMPVERRLNDDVTTAFPIDQAVPDMAPGVYIAVANTGVGAPQDWEARATQWFIVSDLGLAAVSAADGVHGFVRSLASAAPLPDVEVRLIARNNEVLATAKTDAQGAVAFDAGLARGTGGSAPAVLVAQGAGGDYGFLDLTAAGFDLSDRGVAGRAAPGPLDAYVYTERGVYRPGSEVHVTALLRDRQANAVTGVPLTAVFSRPDGVEHRRVQLPDMGLGGRTYSLPLPATAMTGTWRIAVYADPKGTPAGEQTFLVEDFVPDRLALQLAPLSPAVPAGGVAQVAVEGRFLYGAPAADLGLEGEVVLRPRKDGLDGFGGYAFGLADDEAAPVRRPLFELPRTDAKGQASIAAPLPPLPESTKPFTAEVTLRLREPGGRAVQRTASVLVAPQGAMIGIRSLFKDGHVSEGSSAGFEVVAVAPDGKRTALKGLRWQLSKIEQRFQWYREGGDLWRYEPITYTRRVADGRLDTAADAPVRLETPVEFGRYRLEISPVEAQADGPATSVLFTAGWYAAEAADTPDFLDLALDKAAYRPGDTARVTLTPRAPGKALVAVVKDGILAMRAVDLADKQATVAFEVGADWTPGAYVTAMLYRPMDVSNQRMPTRSVGVAWLGVERGPRELGVRLVLPDKVAPRGELALPIEISGLAAGEEAHLTVAAVDVGILNLTGYQAPAPEDWYYAQRRLGVEIRDLYGRLIDGMRAQRGRLRSGGDGGGGMSMQGSPPTQEPVALYSGIVRPDPEGKARVAFDIPNFNGTLKVMAVAWSKSKLGHAAAEVVVRDPVIVAGSLPRFLAQGDKTRLHLSIDNVEGPAGSYKVSLAAEGPLEAAGAEQTLTLDRGGRATATFALAASGVGAATLTAHLSGPGGVALDQTFALDVKPASPPVTRRTVQTLAAHDGALTLSRDLLGGYVSGTARATLSVSPTAAFDVPGLLLALDRYPYGCAEQTTSKALPLLYVNDVAAQIGLARDAALSERVEKAIDSLLGMQSSSGGFGLWGPGDDIWLTAYVADFLSRAREHNYAVPQVAFDLALDRLHNHVVNSSEVEDGGEGLAYALFVLARAGRANVGDLRYFAEAKLDAFATPLAKAQLAAALALYGDTERAERAFTVALADQTPVEAARRTDYGTTLRDWAGMLTLAAETGVRKAAIPALAQTIVEAKDNGGGRSTQENAWLLMAANALHRQARQLALVLDGKQHDGAVFTSFTADALAKAPVTLANRGDAPVVATVTVSGSPVSPEAAAARGFKLERNYYSLDGKPLALDAVTQNDRVVVTLKVTEIEAMHTRLLLADHLPAGFEIENPRQGPEQAGGAQLPWFVSLGTPEHTGYRDDRFVAAYQLDGNEPAVLSIAYVVRAVTPGRFAHPAAVVEDMYRPERFARTGSGTLAIAAAR